MAPRLTDEQIDYYARLGIVPDWMKKRPGAERLPMEDLRSSNEPVPELIQSEAQVMEPMASPELEVPRSNLQTMTPSESDAELQFKKPGLFESKYAEMSPEEADAAIMAEEPAKEESDVLKELDLSALMPQAPKEIAPEAKPEEPMAEAPTDMPPPAESPKVPSREELYEQLKKKYSFEGTDVGPEALRDAQSKRDVGVLAGGITEGLADIATGGKADSGFYKELRSRADQPVKNIEERRKEIAERLGLDEKLVAATERMAAQARDAQLDDPNDPRIKSWKALIETQNPDLVKMYKGQGIWDAMTWRQVQDGLGKIQEAFLDREAKKEESEIRRQEAATKSAETSDYRQQIASQKQQEEGRRVGKTIADEAQRLGRGDKIIQEQRKQMAAFEEVDNLLNQSKAGNEQAISALGTRLARAMGEVGVLTDADVTRYIAGQSWGRKFMDWATRGLKGELPKSSVEDLEELTKQLRDVYNHRINRNYDEAAKILMERTPQYVDQFSGEREPMTIEKAKRLVGHPNAFEEQKQSEDSDAKRKRLEELRAKKAQK